ncbi:MAG TPA: hypothetical protein VFV81_05865 [Verrucomicrobiae bacterium]|nr:hypothetical protein [Verrucomicrobiae bacterium]
MKSVFNLVAFSVLALLAWLLPAENSTAAARSGPAGPATNGVIAFDLQSDHPGRLTFFGSSAAELFSREIDESLKGALARDYVSRPNDRFPAGFLNASPPGQPWYGTMWTRDSGTFLRELVFWGYYQHAGQVAQLIMDDVGTNADGYIAFPRFLDPHQGRLSGSEMDGQAATIIGMVALWQRLPADDPFRARLYDYLHQPSSPVRGIDHFVQAGPLVPGSGEFGGGKGHDNYNVVQNNLCALALLAAANMEEAMGDHAAAGQWRQDAKKLFRNIQTYLVNEKGSWIWGIETNTMKPNRTDTDSATRGGSGGLNGVVCMSADVLGFLPADWPWQGAVANGRKTFDELYAFPRRKEQFDRYGFWAQMNYTHGGMLTSPSYGQGYALQDMLLFDRLDMAGHGLDFLAQATYQSPGVVFSFTNQNYGRLSPYYFYERMYSPEAKGKIELTAGCGPLNLVNVAEPLKVARLIAGVDDTSRDKVLIIPRLPDSWTGYRMENWPVLTSRGVVRTDIFIEKKDGRLNFQLQVKGNGVIPRLRVRLPGSTGMVWKEQDEVKEFRCSAAIR